MDAEAPGSGFFRNSGKLKYCVDDTLFKLSGGHGAGGGKIPTGQNNWAKDTVSLLQDMFSPKAAQRPSSKTVADDLKSLTEKYKNVPEDELETELKRHSRQEYPKERFDEI